MLQESLDLRAEVDEFHSFLQTLEPADWQKPTLFKSWTPWDVVAHLHYFDHMSVLALNDEDAFAIERKALIEAFAAQVGAAELARDKLGALSAPQLLERWLETNQQMATGLGESDPKRRLPWFGPDMGVRMFTTARYMETWAHSQEVYDLKRVERSFNDRIKNIATIGVKTFGWTFVNRGLEAPGPAPYLRLVAPSGEVWEWNESSDLECVRGSAVDFCHVVTQGRSIGDTALEVVGEVATRWMAIAQCFAGGPQDPPKAGARTA